MRKKIGLMILIICTSILTASIAYGADLVISTADELRAFATAVNNGNNYSGKTVELANDIDLENVEFTPIGNSYDCYFLGTFDGKEYEIKNLYISDESLEYVGLFGNNGGYIKNLTVSGNITEGNSDACVGGIVGSARRGVNIEKCVSNVMITSNGRYIGGIVGNTLGDVMVNVINCENRANITATSSSAVVGGIFRLYRAA